MDNLLSLLVMICSFCCGTRCCYRTFSFGFISQRKSKQGNGTCQNLLPSVPFWTFCIEPVSTNKSNSYVPLVLPFIELNLYLTYLKIKPQKSRVTSCKLANLYKLLNTPKAYFFPPLFCEKILRGPSSTR